MLYIEGDYMNKQQLDGRCSSNIETLAREFGLTAHQAEQLQKYEAFLVEWNEKFNLTAIVESDKIAQYHFYDSLAISRYVDFSQIKVAADVGTGAGFPAIPLKIMFPHIKMVLIEVNSKKRTFLEYVAQELGLEEVVTYPN